MTPLGTASTPEPTAAPVGAPTDAAADAAHLREQSELVARLLDEVRALASPAAWERVERLVGALVDLYGAGLGRLLGLVADGDVLEERIRARLAGDELVAGLLALHGLHPLDAATRIRAALVEAAPLVGTVELRGLDEGVARLRVVAGSAPRLRSDRLEQALAQLVADTVPEVRRVAVEGLPPREAAASPPLIQPLVQIDLGRSRATHGDGRGDQ